MDTRLRAGARSYLGEIIGADLMCDKECSEEPL